MAELRTGTETLGRHLRARCGELRGPVISRVALVIGSQALAIVWAQWRSLANYHGRSRRTRFPITAIFAFLWYGLWAFLSISGRHNGRRSGQHCELLINAACPAPCSWSSSIGRSCRS